MRVQRRVGAYRLPPNDVTRYVYMQTDDIYREVKRYATPVAMSIVIDKRPLLLNLRSQLSVARVSLRRDKCYNYYNVRFRCGNVASIYSKTMF